MTPIRLLLVDDHALFREGLAGLLAYQDDMEVVGEAATAADALAAARRLQPDVVLMDLDLPGESGIAATYWITTELPTSMVVVLTAYDDADQLLQAIKAGAHGYLIKNIRSTELLEQLRALVRGEAAISRRMATRLLAEFRHQPAPAIPETDLTSREVEVLQLVAARLVNKEIAARLTLSEHTVKNHLKNILAKLHVRNRREAAAYARARGWVRPTDTPP
jgi:DNA-binding NarL/FixJ family response regulator